MTRLRKISWGLMIAGFLALGISARHVYLVRNSDWTGSFEVDKTCIALLASCVGIVLIHFGLATRRLDEIQS